MGVELMQAQRVVVGRDDHDALGSGLLRMQAELDRLLRRLRTGVREDRDAAGGGLNDRVGDMAALGVGQRRELTRRAEGYKPMDTRRHHAIDMSLDPRIIDRKVIGERRDQGDEDAGNAHACTPDRVRAGIGLMRRAKRVGLKGSSRGGTPWPRISLASARDVPGPRVTPSIPWPPET